VKTTGTRPGLTARRLARVSAGSGIDLVAASLHRIAEAAP
jgi:hypothetical protein